MKDLSHPAWIKTKGILFLLVGFLATALVMLENPTWKTAGFLVENFGRIAIPRPRGHFDLQLPVVYRLAES